MKLSTRFNMLLLALTLVSIGASILILYNIQGAKQESLELKNRKITAIISAKDLKFHTIQVQQWLTDISATRGLDGLNDGFHLAEQHASYFFETLTQLQELLPEYKSTLNTLKPAFQAYYRAGKNMAQFYVESGPSSGNLKMADFDKQSENINNKVDTFVAQISTETASALHTHNERLVQTRFISIAASCFVLVSILILYFNFSSVLKRLPVVELWLTQIREGKVDIDINPEQHCAIGEIAKPIEDLREVLENIIWGIRQTVTHISSDAEKLFSASHDSCDSLEEQQNEILQIAAAANEMSASSQEVALSISRTSNAIREVNNETVTGQNIVRDAISAINQLSDHIQRTTNEINHFGDKAESITSVIGVIKSIAEQTNLLALNAAIEAARAGEQGRGFAVVADEVRSLASRTQDSTEEINRMIQELNLGASRSVQAMNESCSIADLAVEKAKECGLSLTNITASVSNIDDMSNQISASAEEQSAVAEDVSMRITLISSNSEQTLSNVKSLTGIVDEQQQFVSKLISQVQHFQLNPKHHQH